MARTKQVKRRRIEVTAAPATSVAAQVDSNVQSVTIAADALTGTTVADVGSAEHSLIFGEQDTGSEEALSSLASSSSANADAEAGVEDALAEEQSSAASASSENEDAEDGVAEASEATRSLSGSADISSEYIEEYAEEALEEEQTSASHSSSSAEEALEEEEEEELEEQLEEQLEEEQTSASYSSSSAEEELEEEQGSSVSSSSSSTDAEEEDEEEEEEELEAADRIVDSAQTVSNDTRELQMRTQVNTLSFRVSYDGEGFAPNSSDVDANGLNSLTASPVSSHVGTRDDAEWLHDNDPDPGLGSAATSTQIVEPSGAEEETFSEDDDAQAHERRRRQWLEWNQQMSQPRASGMMNMFAMRRQPQNTSNIQDMLESNCSETNTDNPLSRPSSRM